MYPLNYLSLPAAVYSAIALFLVKEFLEWRRRRKADQRKLKVFKQVLAHECERNHWFIKALRDLAKRGQEEKGPYRITVGPSGHHSWGFYDTSGQLTDGGGLPKVRLEATERLAIEAAYLDALFASKVSAALDAVLGLKHLRDGVLDYAKDQPGFLTAEALQEGFYGYALSELESNYEALSDLYRECTGKALEDHRLL